MKTNIEKSKILAVGLGVAFLVAIFFALSYYSLNGTLKEKAEMERLNSENLLSEKMALTKDINKVKSDLTAMKAKNNDLGNSIAKLNEKISAKQAEINQLIKENKDANQIKAIYAELKELKDQLANQVNALNKEKDALDKEKMALNNAIDKLKAENQQLTDNMQIIAANNFLIEALKGKKEKLTVSASKTKKIKADFEIPVNITEMLNFKIKLPDGTVVDSKTDKTISLNTVSVGTDEMYASNSPLPVAPIKTRKVNMVYQPLEKLSPGIYRIDVYNNGTYLGTSQVKLK
ncbi:MAG: hypothetical protein R2750_01310 [Bacteroidales bacterium]